MSWTSKTGKEVASPAKRRTIDTSGFTDLQLRDLVLYIASLSRNPKLTQAQIARVSGMSSRNLRMRFREVATFLKAELADESIDLEGDD